jgi:hypothetical protein
MRQEDLKVQAIAKATGMIYSKDGRDYSTPVTVGDLTMEFEYSNPDTHAYIEVYQKGIKRAVNVYMEDFEDVQIDYPQFFN